MCIRDRGLDVAGYRDKRESDLTALAQRIGAKVRKTGPVSYTHLAGHHDPWVRKVQPAGGMAHRPVQSLRQMGL